MVAVALPEAWGIVGAQLKGAQPLRALPEVEVRDEQADRAAMLGLERLAIVAVGDPRLPAGEVVKRQVRGVAAVRVGHHEGGAGLEPVEQRVDRDAGPCRVELRPLCDAVDVDGDLLVGQGGQLVPRPAGGHRAVVLEDGEVQVL